LKFWKNIPRRDWSYIYVMFFFGGIDVLLLKKKGLGNMFAIEATPNVR